MSSDYTFNYTIILDKIYERCDIDTIYTELNFVLLNIKCDTNTMHWIQRSTNGITKTQHSLTNYTTAEVPDLVLSLPRTWILHVLEEEST